MKKRIITLTLSILAVIMLVGVGFASWVISQGDSTEAQGNILVETIADKRLKVSAEVTGNIQFGAPATGATTGWLREDATAGAVVSENLDVTLTVTVERPTSFSADELAALQVNPVFATTGDPAYAYILNGSNEKEAYPVALFNTGAITETSRALDSADDKKAIIVFNVSLVWGSLFGTQNPYVFFNAHLVSDALSDLAATANTALGLSGEGALAATSTYGDLALAALSKVYEYNSYKFAITVNVQ